MVRINLLPERKQAKARGAATASEPGQLWLVILMGILVVEVVVCLLVQGMKESELTQAVVANTKISNSIEELKREMANHDDIKAQLKMLRDREDAINKLRAARSGPTTVLLELSRILSPGKGPTADRDKIEQLKRDDPQAVPNPNWDPRRVWVTSYQELERSVKIGGVARDTDDVSEVGKRLILSDYFSDVRLLPGEKYTDAETKLELVRFDLTAKVKY
jgi:type IV pilus assembly protein PilN